MVKFKLIEINGDIIHYEYYPEGDKEDKGIFIFNPAKEEIIRHDRPKTYGNNYYGHFLNGIRDKETGGFKEKDIVAWY